MVVGKSADRSLLDIDAVQLKSGGFTWCWDVEVVIFIIEYISVIHIFTVLKTIK